MMRALLLMGTQQLVVVAAQQQFAPLFDQFATPLLLGGGQRKRHNPGAGSGWRSHKARIDQQTLEQRQPLAVSAKNSGTEVRVAAAMALM